jgi:SAM-dependent methyltransferase
MYNRVLTDKDISKCRNILEQEKWDEIGFHHKFWNIDAAMVKWVTILEEFKSIGKNNLKVIELGSADGCVPHIIASWGNDVTGIDLNSVDHWCPKGLSKMILGDALYELKQMEDASVDVVIDSCSVHCFEPVWGHGIENWGWKNIADEVYRVLKPNGRLISSTDVTLIPDPGEFISPENLIKIVESSGLKLTSEYQKEYEHIDYSPIYQNGVNLFIATLSFHKEDSNIKIIPHSENLDVSNSPNMSISVICACKNRYDSLRVSLNSWLSIKNIQEIIIVDWSSDEPLNHLTKLDSRIKIVRVEDKKYFNQPQPLNLAASLATGDYILKLDTDYLINPYYNFVEKYFPDHNSFTSGSYNTNSPEYLDPETGLYMINKHEMSDEQLKEYFNSYSPYFLYLTGLLFISKENYNKIGGYNENLGKCYAYEDDEIFQRLRYMGLNENKLDYDNYLIHLPHPDGKRTENFEGFGWDENYKNMIRENLSPNYSGQELEWQVEYALSQKHIEENKNMIGKISDYYVKPKTNWNIVQMDDQNYFAEEINMKNKLDGLVSVYYMSLEECVDRQKSIEDQFEKYNISPKSIISKRFSESNDIVTGKYLDTLNDGTKGCCVSHLKAIKDWYENTQEDYGFFCEDDLSLETVDYWDFTWDEFIDSLPEDADCVQLLTIRSNFDTFEIRERYWDDWAATAYILTRDYAKKIIDNYIKGDTYHLEVVNYDVMPLIENIIFTSLGKTYTIPLFVENTEFVSTFENNDDDVNGGQKTNHKVARDLVLEWWKNKDRSEKEINLNPIVKSEIEELITTYSLDTENAENNFALGVWYENQGHTAPALTYFLRCAERAEDEDLAYEALIRGSYCYEKQGTRDGSARSLLWQAQAFLPQRPEAYFLLSRFAEKREWWQDCYMNADLALRYCNFDCPPLKTNVEYPGKYGLLFEKAISGWQWGKSEETKSLLKEILSEYKEIDSKHLKAIYENLEKIGEPVTPVL